MRNFEVFIKHAPLYMENNNHYNRYADEMVRSCDNKVFVTDTHQMLILDQIVYPELLLDKLKQSSICIKEKFPRGELIKTLYVSNIADALNKIPDEPVMKEISEEETCGECDGFGTVEWEYFDCGGVQYRREFDCPCCDGTGTIKIESQEPTGEMRKPYNSFINIHELQFRAEFIENMCKVATADTVDPVDSINVFAIRGKRSMYEFIIGEYLHVIIAGVTHTPEGAQVEYV